MRTPEEGWKTRDEVGQNRGEKFSEEGEYT